MMSESPMVEVTLLLPRRIWDQVAQYAQEAAARAQAQGEPPEACAVLADPGRLGALLLEQAVENEQRLRQLGSGGSLRS